MENIVGVTGGNSVLEVNKTHLNEKIKALLSLSDKHTSHVEYKLLFDFLVSFSDEVTNFLIGMICKYYKVGQSITDMKIMFHNLIYTRGGSFFSYKCAIDFKLGGNSMVIDMDVDRIGGGCRGYQYTLKSKGLLLNNSEEMGS